MIMEIAAVYSGGMCGTGEWRPIKTNAWLWNEAHEFINETNQIYGEIQTKFSRIISKNFVFRFSTEKKKFK